MLLESPVKSFAIVSVFDGGEIRDAVFQCCLKEWVAHWVSGRLCSYQLLQLGKTVTELMIKHDQPLGVV